MALKKALPDRNLARKINYRTGIWLSKSLTGRENGSQKGITGREFGSQNHLLTKLLKHIISSVVSLA